MVLLCVFVALAGCDWTQIGFGPGQTNANPDEAALSASSVANLTTAWSQPCECFTPLVAGGVVYVSNFLGGVNPRPVRLEALDENTGATKWAVTFASVNDAQFLAIGNGLAYVRVSPVSGSDQLVAYDAGNGAFRWQTLPPAPTIGTASIRALLDRGLLLVVADIGNAPEVSAIDTNGRVIWSVAPSGPVSGMAADAGRLYVTTTVTISDPPSSHVLLLGLSETTGAVQSGVLIQSDQAGGRVVFANGLVYDGGLAFHPDTGAIAWSAPGEFEAAVTPSAALMVAAGAIVARDPLTGAPRWFAPAGPCSW